MKPLPCKPWLFISKALGCKVKMKQIDDRSLESSGTEMDIQMRCMNKEVSMCVYMLVLSNTFANKLYVCVRACKRCHWNRCACASY